MLIIAAGDPPEFYRRIFLLNSATVCSIPMDFSKILFKTNIEVLESLFFAIICTFNDFVLFPWDFPITIYARFCMSPIFVEHVLIGVKIPITKVSMKETRGQLELTLLRPSCAIRQIVLIRQNVSNPPDLNNEVTSHQIFFRKIKLKLGLNWVWIVGKN